MDSRESLVDLIFGKCALVYGRDFLGRWEGMSIAEVKADWLRELGWWLERPQAIKYALENLPERPPHVLQFRTLCGHAPRVKEVEPHEIELTPEQKLAGAEVKRKAVAALKLMGSKPRADA